MTPQSAANSGRPSNPRAASSLTSRRHKAHHKPALSPTPQSVATIVTTVGCAPAECPPAKKALAIWAKTPTRGLTKRATKMGTSVSNMKTFHASNSGGLAVAFAYASKAIKSAKSTVNTRATQSPTFVHFRYGLSKAPPPGRSFSGAGRSASFCLYFAAVLLLGLAGCEERRRDRHETAAEDCRCSPEEMARVERETVFCTEKGGFFSTYCYETALIRNCVCSALRDGGQ